MLRASKALGMNAEAATTRHPHFPRPPPRRRSARAASLASMSARQRQKRTPIPRCACAGQMQLSVLCCGVLRNSQQTGARTHSCASLTQHSMQHTHTHTWIRLSYVGEARLPPHHAR